MLTLLQNRAIACIATAFSRSPSRHSKLLVVNARTLESPLVEQGYKLQTGGTDDHLRPPGLTIHSRQGLRLGPRKHHHPCETNGSL